MRKHRWWFNSTKFKFSEFSAPELHVLRLAVGEGSSQFWPSANISRVPKSQHRGCCLLPPKRYNSIETAIPADGCARVPVYGVIKNCIWKALAKYRVTKLVSLSHIGIVTEQLMKQITVYRQQVIFLNEEESEPVNFMPYFKCRNTAFFPRLFS